MKRWFWWVAPTWAAAASVLLLVMPTVATMRETLSLGQRSPAVSPPSLSSLLSAQGPSVIPPLALPVIASILPLLGRTARTRRILGTVATVLLGVFCVLGAWSVGLFYVPSLVALVAALAMTSGERRPASRPDL